MPLHIQYTPTFKYIHPILKTLLLIIIKFSVKYLLSSIIFYHYLNYYTFSNGAMRFTFWSLKTKIYIFGFNLQKVNLIAYEINIGPS